jgi:hypothetical protein
MGGYANWGRLEYGGYRPSCRAQSSNKCRLEMRTLCDRELLEEARESKKVYNGLRGRLCGTLAHA